MNPFGDVQADDLDALIRRSQEQLAKVSQLQEQLQEIVGRGTSDDGLIEVSISHNGQVEDLDLNPRVMRLDSVTLAENLKAAIRAAQVNLQDQITAVTTEALGESPMDYINDPSIVQSKVQEVQEGYERGMNSVMADIDRIHSRLK